MRAFCGSLLLAARALSLEQLPSFRAASSEAANNGAAQLVGAQWWSLVGDHVYTAPSVGIKGLGHDIGDYYCAVGADSALSEAMRERRVGGSGKWHVFYLPEGPSVLGSSPRGSRRSSISALMQLRHGHFMPAKFPVYQPSEACPSQDSASRQQELDAVSRLTVDKYLDTLKEIVDLKNNDGAVTRSFSDSSGSANAQTYLKEHFKSLGLATCLQKFTYSGTPQANVLAVIPGSTKDSLTIGAHYDSRPFQGSAPGAEDNGSGLAALLSIARAYTSSGIKPNKTLHFVAFAGEEAGLLGSDHFAKLLHRGQSAPEFCGEEKKGAASFLQTPRMLAGGASAPATSSHEAIALDEIGWLTPKYTKATVNLESYDWAPELMNHLACSSREHNGDSLEIVHSNSPFGSDHMSFLSRDMKAVLVINGDDESYPNYHKSSDTLDNVTPEYATKIAKMVLGATIRIAGSRPL